MTGPAALALGLAVAAAAVLVHSVAVHADDDGAAAAAPVPRSCGAIHALGKRPAVDIVEGRLPLTCAAARFVMSRYLARRFVRYGTVRYRGMTFECWEARPGIGWDYHCLHSTLSGTDYVDVGAGRRPRR